jgi:hypothetical protein
MESNIILPTPAIMPPNTRYEQAGTLDHEMFHAAMAMVLTKAEQKTMLDKYGSMEAFIHQPEPEPFHSSPISVSPV